VDPRTYSLTPISRARALVATHPANLADKKWKCSLRPPPKYANLGCAAAAAATASSIFPILSRPARKRISYNRPELPIKLSEIEFRYDIPQRKY
jgi:hypothetical protein